MLSPGRAEVVPGPSCDSKDGAPFGVLRARADAGDWSACASWSLLTGRGANSSDQCTTGLNSTRLWASV